MTLSPCSDPPKAPHCPQCKSRLLSPCSLSSPALSLPHSPLPSHLMAPATCSFRFTYSFCSVPPQGLCTCCARLLKHLFLPFSSTWPLLTLQFSVLSSVLFQLPDCPNHVNPPAPLQALKSPHTCQSQMDSSDDDLVNVHLPHWAMSSLWAGIIVSPTPGTE